MSLLELSRLSAERLRRLEEADKKFVWHPYTPIPHLGPKTMFTRAQGAFLFDADGKRYFDATSSWWCQTHGHCHPRLVAALSKQASELDQILFSPHSHPVAVELAERLVEKLGSPFQRVFYSDDGSTAVECALKMAVQFWHNQGQKHRSKFVSLDLAYHGDTMGAVSVSQIGEFHHYFEGMRAGSLKIPVPRSVEDVNAAIASLLPHREEIAAVIVEPLVLGAGGMIFYPAEALETLVKGCQEQGWLVIFDEVFTGFGRTGTMFAMHQLKSRPDIVCLSKGLTAGMLPLAATVTTERVFEAFGGNPAHTFYHGHTFTANALGCSVALESLKLFDDESTLDRNRELAAVMAREGERFKTLPHVAEVRQLGMIWVARLCDRDGQTPSPRNRPGWRIAEAAWQRGIYLRPLHDIVYCLPLYCAQESELREFFSVLYSEIETESHFQE